MYRSRRVFLFFVPSGNFGIYKYRSLGEAHGAFVHVSHSSF